MADAKLTEDCYGLPSRESITPPRPHLSHPAHDWVRTVTGTAKAGETLICCLTCCNTAWVAETDKILALPLMDLMLGGDLDFRLHREAESDSIHWVLKETRE